VPHEFLRAATGPGVVHSGVRNRRPTWRYRIERLVVQHHGGRRDFINQPRRPVVAHLAVRANVVSIVFATIRVAADLKFGLFAGMTIASAIPYAVVSMAVPRAGRRRHPHVTSYSPAALLARNHIRSDCNLWRTALFATALRLFYFCEHRASLQG